MTDLGTVLRQVAERIARFNGRTRHPLGKLMYRAGLLILVVGLGVHFAMFLTDAAVRPSHGFIAYYTAARLVDEGADVSLFYDDAWFKAHTARYHPQADDIYNVNLPTMALMMLPLAAFDYTQARIVWTVLNLLWFAGAAGVLFWQLKLRDIDVLLTLTAFILLYQPLYANFNLGQAYVLLFGLLVLAWYGYRRRHATILGLALGLMLVLKSAGSVLWVILVIGRRWRALAWSAATVLVVAVGSLPWLSLPAWQTYFGLAREVTNQPWLAVTAYQTHFSFFRHLFVFDSQWNPAPLFQAPVLGMWLPWLGTLLIVAVSARLASLPNRDDLGFAAFVIASVVLSPVALDYHYTLLLLPAIVVLTRAPTWQSVWPKVALVMAVALMAADLPYRSPKLMDGAWAFLAYPKLYGALLLWGLTVMHGAHSALRAL